MNNSNSRSLRLAFVMGGGVSLGTFSGAALSESIKQLIVYGRYENGKNEQGSPVYNNYKSLEIDIFSGASAGAISLGIMLRVLTNHRDKFKLLGFASYSEMRKMLENKILGQFGEDALRLKTENPQKYEGLLAAQAVQEFQEKIWSKEINLEKLLGTGDYQKELSNNSGLLDRSVVDDLGRKYFNFEEKNERIKHRSLLADRVLFACTLSNMNFTVKKHKIPYHSSESPFLKALNDTNIDKVHSELRVFDINFGEINPATVPYYPLRWVQYHLGEPMNVEQQDKKGKFYKKTFRNLESDEVWKEISATAIASGAFPFAFEPVVLNRYKHEFAEDWPKELKDKERYRFTYFDGGTFNNEPIKEGMRLASYIDNINNTEDFDRMVIFVDPMVSDLETQFKVNVHQELGIRRSWLNGKTKITPKSTLLKLVGKIPQILNAILNEARGLEIDKISFVLEQFENRKKLRQFYKKTIAEPDNDIDIIEMRSFVVEELEKFRKKLDLPPNVLQIQHELLRIIEEEKEFFVNKLPLMDKNALIDQMQQFIYLPEPSKVPNIRLWMVALSCVSLDLAMQLTGKTQRAKIIPIAPFNFYENKESYELMKLPGAGILGFAGFASDSASQYEVRYGQYCAFRVLKDLAITGNHKFEMSLPIAFDYRNFNDAMKQSVGKSVMKRIREIIPTELSSVMPFMEGYVETGIIKFINENIDNREEPKTIEFRIQVINDLVLLRGYNDDGTISGKKSVEPIRINNDMLLITQLLYYPEKQLWEGDFVNSEQKLFIDKMRLFDNSPSVSIDLPKLMKNDEIFIAPNPVLFLDARAHINLTGFSEIKKTKWVLLNNVSALDENLWD